MKIVRRSMKKSALIQVAFIAKWIKKILVFGTIIIPMLFALSTYSLAAEFGSVRTDIEVSDAIDSLPYSASETHHTTNNNFEILGDKLIIPWTDFGTPDHYYSLVSVDGTVVTKKIAISPVTADSAYTEIIYKALSNGNILVYWHPASSGQGLTDTYFKIIDSGGNEIVAATKINSAPGELNWKTKAAELSNGNLAFIWSTSGTDYALRRFTANGAAVDASQISITGLTGTTGESQYTHHIAASSGRFMITTSTAFDNNFRGLIFENASTTPVQFGGQNYFIIDSFGESNWVTQLAALSNGKFLAVYVRSLNGQTDDRRVAIKIYNEDGSLYEDAEIRQVYSWGKLYKPIIVDGGFYLYYISDNISSNEITGSYFEYYNNEGSFIENYDLQFPSLSGDQYAVTSVFKDVDGNMSYIINDREDAGADYNTWLLRCPMKVTPTVTWPTISGITYGQAFSSAMGSDGSAVYNGTQVDGVFSIEDANVIPGVAGSPYTKTITFTPANTTLYNTATHTASIAVSKANPTVNSWPAVSAITYGQPFSSSVTGGSAGIPGSFIIQDAAVVPDVVGSPYIKTVTFVPANSANYNTASQAVSVTVNKADAVISDITCPDKPYDGAPLAPGATIINGTGSIVYTYSGTGIDGSTSTAPSGVGSYTVTATLAASANYNEAVKTKAVTISKADQTSFAITGKPGSNPAYGDEFILGTSGGNGTGAVTWGAAGGASVTAGGEVTVTGMEAVTITATKAGDDSYNQASATYSFTPEKATPTVSNWPSISSITYGDSFADAMANDGSASIAGAFSIEDASVEPGVSGSPYSKILTFTPADTVRYKNITNTVSITVNKANAAISDITCPDKPYDGDPLAPSITIINGTGSIVYTYSGTGIAGSTSTAPSGAGSYTVTATLAASANYNEAVKTKAVTISKADQAGFAITGKPVSTPAYGDVFSLGTSGGNGTGAVTWGAAGGASVTAAGEVTVTGMEAVTITATKAGDDNYNSITDTYLFTPVKATPDLGTVSASYIYVNDTLDNSNLSRTVNTVSGTLAWEANAGFSSAAAGSKTATYSFTPTGADAALYRTLTGQSVNINVNTRKILSISAPTAITNKSYGTVQGDLGLPSTVSVAAQGISADVTRSVPVTWSGYNANTLSAQTLTGTLDLTGNTELSNVDSLAASISVTLQPLPVKNIVDVSADIKVGSTDGTALLKALVTGQFDGSVDIAATDAANWAGFPVNFNTVTADTQTVTVRVKFVAGSVQDHKDVIISYDIVNPESLAYATPVITAIDATNAQNASEAALLAYVNGHRALTSTWPAGAIGTTALADNAPAYTVLPEAYVKTGKTYGFSQSYLGKTLTQSVTVNEVKQDTPALTVDYQNETIDCTTAMDYSTAPGVWNNCTAGMPIDPWLGSTVSFRTNAQEFKTHSDTVIITFPAREAAPASLGATINDTKTEVIISGIATTVAYEYSLDGTNYFDLSADGKVTVPAYQEYVHIRKRFIVGTSVHSVAAAVNVKYTMTFSTGPGSSVSPAYGADGEKIAAPVAPARYGYTFGGWYSEDNGLGSLIIFPYTMTGNITVYAKWNLKSSSDTSSPSSPPSSPGISVIVDGEEQNAGTSSTTTTIDDETVTTVTVDDEKLEKMLDSKGDNPTVVIPVSNGADVVVAELGGQTIKKMEEKEAVLEIKTESITYTLPASQINIDDVSSRLGEQVQIGDVKVSLRIAEPPHDTVRIVEDTANKNNYQVVVKPVEFEITCTSGDKTVNVSKFNGYVERTIAIPDGIDPSKITTGIVLNNDGTFSHVPTTIIVVNGKYYAKINSLTNSIYSVIYNPVKFTDVENHWAKKAVNDMGSRLVVSGVGKNLYEPDRDMTRAEFAAIIVKALGLRAGADKNTFNDVGTSEWYYESIKAATEYKIISGYGNGEFGPNDKITREQAMVMIDRAMKITGLEVTLTDMEIINLLSGYEDASPISGYAKPSVAICLKIGIITGKGGKGIAPGDNITRAEVAVIIQRLLQKSNLI